MRKPRFEYWINGDRLHCDANESLSYLEDARLKVLADIDEN
ncbi:hypothetical protein MGWOODY_XGa2524 [hydrothermal vent metagenome]|uniref:Uncharacterized protein n=1 Tax=hydrothermal vent metagenome TaxID=652676 RepID=A0A160TVE5_9ZZZZ